MLTKAKEICDLNILISIGEDRTRPIKKKLKLNLFTILDILITCEITFPPLEK